MRIWFTFVLAFLLLCGDAPAKQSGRAGPKGPTASFSQLIGRPTDSTITISVLSEVAMDAYVEYGVAPETLDQRSPVRALGPGVPAAFELTELSPDTRYSYRVLVNAIGSEEDAFVSSGMATFQTQRAREGSFTFAVQGDSHPERIGRMYDPDLYIRTLTNVTVDQPDFYFMMGDDFSIERLIQRGPKSQAAVDAVYASQRGYLGLVGKSAPLMLVNGNHEQAAKYMLDGTADNFAVFAGNAKNTYFPLPSSDGIYTGNESPVEHIGLLHNYYAWEWGDALFVVIDPYWHTDVAVDNAAGATGPARNEAGEPVERRRRRDADPDRQERRRDRDREGDEQGRQPGASDMLLGVAQVEEQPEQQTRNRGGGGGQRDYWQITLGDEQYQWLQSTLLNSDAAFKFVFSHHVLGTGRGGIEQADKYEWGGNDRRGVDRFLEMRPDWEQPIHDLMRDSGVSIFFQGHDHLYARQELDGVVYQSCPNPADPTFTAFNRDAYKSGDIFPNSGHLRVTVTGGDDASCKVEYVRSLRPSDESEGLMNGTIVHAYTVSSRAIAPTEESPIEEPSE